MPKCTKNKENWVEICEPRNTPKFSFGCEILETILLGLPKHIAENHTISLSFLYFDNCNELSNPQDIYHGSAPSFRWWRSYNLKSLSSNSRAKGQGIQESSVIHSIAEFTNHSSFLFTLIGSMTTFWEVKEISRGYLGISPKYCTIILMRVIYKHRTRRY